jgi:hypothetical protein
MEKMIKISEWKLKKIENAIRITLNAYGMRSKESCLFREMCKACELIDETLKNTHTEKCVEHDISDSFLNVKYDVKKQLIKELEGKHSWYENNKVQDKGIELAIEIIKKL